MKASKKYIKKLNRIAKIIEDVDSRCALHDTVTPTLQEMTQAEISEIYKLSKITDTQSELQKVKFKQSSHMSFTDRYVNLMIGKYRGQTIYRHAITKRINEVELGEARTFFSLTVNGDEMTAEQIIEHFKSKEDE